MPDLDMTRSSLSDVGRLPKFKMAAIETGSGGRIVNSGNGPTSVRIDMQCNRRVRHGRKCGGSRWNLVGAVRSIVAISISRFGGRHLD